MILLFLLFSILVHYGPAWDQRDSNIETEDAHRNYEDHIGDRTFHWYTVVKTDGETHVLWAEPLTLRMTADIDVEEGDTIQVYGILRPNRRIEPINIVNRRSGDRTSLLAISVLGLLLTLGLFFRWWRFDLNAIRFYRRGDT